MSENKYCYAPILRMKIKTLIEKQFRIAVIHTPSTHLFDLHLTSPLHVLDRIHCPIQLNLLKCHQGKAGLARQLHLMHAILHLRARELI